MKHVNRRVQCRILLAFTAFFFAACSQLTGRLPEKPFDPETRALLLKLENINRDLKTFKGLGKIRLWSHGKITVAERVAWIGSEPSKLRIDVLVSGHPGIKIANDGQWFYYLDPYSEKQPFRKIRATEANLKKIVSISIKSSDLMAFLAGRIPLREHDKATLLPNSTGSGYVLELKKKWRSPREKIYLAEDKTRIQKVAIYDGKGDLMYRVEFDGMQTINSYRIPSRLIFSDDNGAVFQLDIKKYWTDVPVTPSLFVLTPP
jgi:hypothetical protein